MKISKELKAQSQDIFLKGYENASKSFSNLSGDTVTVKNFELHFGETPDMLQKILKTRNPTVLVTDIIGEAKGKSYLVLNDTDAQVISEMLLSKMKSLETHPDFNEMILKEVDNMVSASVITELANQLDLKIYGDVPKYFSPDIVNKQWVTDEMENHWEMFAILSCAHFSFQGNYKISPYFIWIFDKDFYKILSEKKLNHAN